MNDEQEILHMGCDGLTVALQGSIPASAHERLDAAKAVAMELGQDASMKIKDVEFNVMKTGGSHTQGYSWIFHTGRDGIKYQAKRSLEASQWNLRARVSAMFLAVNGLAEAHKRIYADLRALGAIIIDESVSDVDFCIDVRMDAKGTARKDAFAIEPRQFVHHSKAKRKEFFSKCDLDADDLSILGGRYVETVTIGGKKSRQLCVYNKRTEQVAKRRKDWFGVWGVDKEDCPNVWRVEYRFGRDFLRDWNISTIEEISECFGDLIKDSLVNIRYVEFGEDSNNSRAPNHPFWDLVIAAFSELCVDTYAGLQRGRVRSVQREEAQEMYEAQILGLSAPLAVVLGLDPDLPNDQAVIDDFIDGITDKLRRHIEFNRKKFDQTRRRAKDRLIFTRQKELS